MATPTATPPTRPPIFSLSTELIVHLAKDLDEDDLLALRITCKELNFKTREVHLSSLYHTRSVYFVPASLENLLKVAKHPSDAKSRLRHIRICPSSPYINPERDVRRKLEEQAKAENPVTVTGTGTDGPMPAGLVLKMYEHSKSEWPAVQHMRQWDLAANMLTVAFSHFPNIQTIELDWKKNHRMTRSEFNLLYPSLGLVSGKRLPNDLVNAISIYMIPLDYKHGGYWNITLNAALITGLSHVEKISDIGLFGDGVPLSWFSMPQSQLSKMKSNFSNLRILHLLVTTDGDRRHRGVRTTTISTAVPGTRHALCKWIEHVGTNVEELRLEDMTSAARYDDGCPLPSLPKLSTLELVGVSLKAESFKELLNSCRMGLRDVTFSQCLLENPKDEWFGIIKDLSQCLLLRKFNVMMKGQWRKEERYPDIEIYGDWKSEKTVCQVMPGIQDRHDTYHRSIHILTKKLSKLLNDHEEAEQFWDSLTDRRWRQWPESLQRRGLRINRQFTFDDDEENAASPQSSGSDSGW
ncbi:hypothetical protein ABW20_dc0103782 [Dactylellina cionopaga]|nr:hypothetical protein ABW20_dc0103782 [Dactylellina cionopaga]